MKCPFCGHLDTQVVETRESDDGDSIRRRRRCTGCDKRFNTFERADLQFPFVVKKNGSREDYRRRKLEDSFALALRKRAVSPTLVEQAISQIEGRLLGLGEKEVPTAFLGELVMRELKKLDKIAYVRFASVYRQFSDLGEFEEVLAEVRPRSKRK